MARKALVGGLSTPSVSPVLSGPSVQHSPARISLPESGCILRKNEAVQFGFRPLIQFFYPWRTPSNVRQSVKSWTSFCGSSVRHWRSQWISFLSSKEETLLRTEPLWSAHQSWWRQKFDTIVIEIVSKEKTLLTLANNGLLNKRKWGMFTGRPHASLSPREPYHVTQCAQRLSLNLPSQPMWQYDPIWQQIHSLRFKFSQFKSVCFQFTIFESDYMGKSKKTS